MHRTVLLIKSEQHLKLVEIAKKEKVSVAEINRRAIAQFLDSPQVNTKELHMLDVLADQLVKSNKEAEKALSEAEKALDQVLKQLKRNKE